MKTFEKEIKDCNRCPFKKKRGFMENYHLLWSRSITWGYMYATEFRNRLKSIKDLVEHLIQRFDNLNIGFI